MVVEVAPGAGRQEPTWWSKQVARMLMRYPDRRGFIVGSQSIVEDAHRFSVSGSNPYRVLKFEAGIHRAHRVPDSEARGRIHTSAAVVRLFDGDASARALTDGIEPERVRTYDYPRGLVKDHRIDLVVGDLSGVLDGGLDEITAALEADEDQAASSSSATALGLIAVTSRP